MKFFIDASFFIVDSLSETTKKYLSIDNSKIPHSINWVYNKNKATLFDEFEVDSVAKLFNAEVEENTSLQNSNITSVNSYDDEDEEFEEYEVLIDGENLSLLVHNSKTISLNLTDTDSNTPTFFDLESAQLMAKLFKSIFPDCETKIISLQDEE